MALGDQNKPEVQLLRRLHRGAGRVHRLHLDLPLLRHLGDDSQEQWLVLPQLQADIRRGDSVLGLQDSHQDGRLWALHGVVRLRCPKPDPVAVRLMRAHPSRQQGLEVPESLPQPLIVREVAQHPHEE